MLHKGLDATASRWPEIEVGYAWVRQACHLLANEPNHPVERVRGDYQGLLAAIAPYRTDLPETTPFLQQAATQFLKVSHSYGAGLFRCYEVTDLPRTNNGMEQYFGSFRYHERRTTGRKVTSPTTVIRGSVRLLASIGTRLNPPTADQLCPRRVSTWRALRTQLEIRQETRRQQRRFRHDPQAYLAAVEERLLRSTLPT